MSVIRDFGVGNLELKIMFSYLLGHIPRVNSRRASLTTTKKGLHTRAFSLSLSLPLFLLVTQLTEEVWSTTGAKGQVIDGDVTERTLGTELRAQSDGEIARASACIEEIHGDALPLITLIAGTAPENVAVRDCWRRVCIANNGKCSNATTLHVIPDSEVANTATWNL